MIPTRPIDFSNAQVARMSEHQLDLKKLADFLWNDPRPRREGKFSMELISKGWNPYGEDPSVLTERCGAACCASGWAVVAFGELEMFEKSLRFDGHRVRNWMFHGGWKPFDNTPLGASFRIDHWLKHQDERLYPKSLDFWKLMAEHYPADLQAYVEEETQGTLV